MDAASKRASYTCPVIYGTNTEFGFDYLRDHMAWSRQDLTQSALDYAIIDEVDSILIDEARTPLIISGAGEGTTQDFVTARDVVNKLRKDEDYTVDEKGRTVYLNDDGERRLRLPGSTIDYRCHGLAAYIRQALVAKNCRSVTTIT